VKVKLDGVESSVDSVQTMAADSKTVTDKVKLWEQRGTVRCS
jgi:hypothetical protein